MHKANTNIRKPNGHGGNAMKLCDLNPHIRFASKIRYTSVGSDVRVTDCRVFYTTAGLAKLRIANQVYTLQPHSLFYCPAGSTYTIEAPEGFDPICLNFDMSQTHNDIIIPYPPCADSWDEMIVFFDSIEDSDVLNGHVYIENAEDLLPVVTKILDAFTTQAPYFRELASCSLKKLLLLLHRDPQAAIPPKIALVKAYIDRNYATEITNKTLAKMAGYHEYYLNRTFLAHTGSSLHEYLLKVRLNHASYLILNADIPLKAVPEQVGFHSYPHFSNYFKQHFGLSPAEYRKNVKNSI